MKRIWIVVTIVFTVFIFTNCQKEVIETTKNIETIKKSDKKVEPKNSRIRFIKSAKVLTDKQQPFLLLYVSRQTKTEMVFLVEYSGIDYKLHNFDFAWDEKLEADKDGKLWMNLKVYHNTTEENVNANNVICGDTAVVNIPDISTFGNDTISKLWLRFINTTNTQNVFIMQYLDSELDSTQQQVQQHINDSTTTWNEGNYGTTPQDSIEDNSETSFQDSLETDYGDNWDWDTMIQDSTTNDYDFPAQDSTGTTTQNTTPNNTWNEGNYGTTPQDSIGDNSETSIKDSLELETDYGDNWDWDTTIQDSTASNN